MRAPIQRQLRDLARRAGVGEVSPVAVVAAGVVFAAVVVLSACALWPRGSDVVLPARASASGLRAETATATSSRAASVPTEAAPLCVVHVVGAVRHPGVYEMHAGQRVTDAVAAAGGLVRDAAPEAVNLAAVLRDGEQIAIPTGSQARTGGTAGAVGSRGAGGAAGTGPVDLNGADVAALDALPGIGPSTAAKIVADREANGPFGSTDDLGRVAGIGPKKLEQLKGLICVR